MPAPGTTNGPMHSVPCAHCGHKNDLRELEAQKLVEVGQGIICDNCSKQSRIVGMKSVMMVVLRQI